VDLLVPDVPLNDYSSSNECPEIHTIKELKAQESMAYESNFLDANLAEAKKRQRMDRGDGKDILDDDSSVDDVTHTARSRPPISEINRPEPSILETKSKQVRRKKLSNIQAFSGKPPLDSKFYIELLSRVKVPLSVLEIAQISPEAALYWIRLMTRENPRKKKSAGIDGNAVEIDEDLLDKLYDYLRSQAESNKAIINVKEKPRMLPMRKKSESPSQISSYIDRPFRIPV
ncbi:hypothetical protein EPUL_006711, partial [Erysiphe pulchra]